jgi:hypothetical protein
MASAGRGPAACQPPSVGLRENGAVSPTFPRASREQNFVRILFLLDRAGEPPGDGAPAEAYSLMRGQTRLQALDFWMRNPDYVADELIDVYERDTTQTWALATAREIFASREPSVRRLPMLKWRFGAYEMLDDTLSIMVSRRLVTHRPEAGAQRVREHLYWLMDAGHDIADQLLAADPVFQWYADRADVVALLAGPAGGAALKQRQYDHPEYGSTSPLTAIRSIEDRVRARLAALGSAAA